MNGFLSFHTPQERWVFKLTAAGFVSRKKNRVNWRYQYEVPSLITSIRLDGYSKPASCGFVSIHSTRFIFIERR